MRALRVALAVLLVPPLLLLALGSAATGLAANLGRTSVRWDILTHFAPVWFAAGCVALVGGFLFRGRTRWLLVVPAAVGVLASGLLIGPELVRDTGPKASPTAPDALKIVQFNVWAHGRDIEPALAWLKQEDPDIAVLEETTPAWRKRLQAEGRWSLSCTSCEVVILSKRPPIETAQLKTGIRSDGPISRATFRDALGDFTVIGVHYAWPTDHEDQQRQERRLAAAIGMFPPDRTIVAGDFNSAPWSFWRRRWDEAFGIPRRDKALFTWPARQSTRFREIGAFPFLPIDHVYAGRGWGVVDVRRGPRLTSDHFPVVVTLAPVARR